MKQECKSGVYQMKESVFRQYDIRGIVGSELIIDDVYDLGKAIAYYFKQEKPNVQTVAIGMDGRHHSHAIKEELVRAMVDSGLDVKFIGVCTSPTLYFALYTMPIDAGLMVTASHNPKDYNGIKISLGTHSVWGLEVARIKDMFFAHKAVKTDRKGTVVDEPVIPEYVDWLAEHFEHLKGMELAAVIDCGNGAAGTVMPQLIECMDWPNVSLLYEEVDGDYPNHEADPTVEENMRAVRELLATTDIDVGMGLDGDCDRMDAMTKSGFLVPGDQLLAIFAQPIIAQHPGAVVVCDIKASSGLQELVEQWGGQLILSPSGHAIIKDTMRKYDALIGGELSCHFFFDDRYFGYDDGIYALIRLFELLHRSGQTLQELISVFPKKESTREYRIACKPEDQEKMVVAIKKEFENRNDVSLLTIDGVRAQFKHGWGIIRASHTQPVICLRFEADTKEHLHAIKEAFYQVLKSFYHDDTLKNELGL